VRLNGLVGANFTIGSVRCRGIRLCEPCATLHHYADRPILRPLVHRGGLRADVLEPGDIRVGDPIAVPGGTASAPRA
jgi:MOSC domain-containing protein YiiM